MTVQEPPEPAFPARRAGFLASVYERMEGEQRGVDFPSAALDELRRATTRMARGSSAGLLDSQLALVATAADVDVAVPTASTLPAVAPLKKVLRKLMAWYVQYLAQQVAALGGAVLQLGKATARELGHLETELSDLRERVAQLEGTTREPSEPDQR